MAIQDIILRSSTHSPLTTKGSELTYGELDGNFIEIYDAITSLNDVSGIAPFNIGTTYTGTEYVSYNGNVYVHISATPTTGVLPDTDPSVWQLTSTGALAHQQNKDSYLAFGSSSQVSATDLADIINNQVINITYENFITAKNNSTLKPNRLYCITNANSFIDTSLYVNSQFKLYVRSLNSNQYSSKGFVSMLVPNYDGYDNYDYTNAYTDGNYVGYGLYVYLCYNDITNGDIPPNETLHWSIISSTSYPEFYTTKFFDIDFNIQSGLINIGKVYDNFNNTFGSNDFLNASIVTPVIIGNNDIDTTSTWYNIYGHANNVSQNKLINSSVIGSKGGTSPNAINQNFFNKGGIYCNEFINGDIYGNNFTNAFLNLEGGNFEGTLANLKISFAVSNTLNVNFDTIANGGYLNEQGGNIYATIDITGCLGEVDLDSYLTHSDIFGEFRLDCNAESISRIRKDYWFCPIVIKPNTLHGSITIQIVTLGGASADNFVSTDYSGNIDLFYDNGDYAIIERIFVNGIYCWNVTKIVKIV
jgi:hypothetical protein